MSLLEFDDQPNIQVLCQQNQRAANTMGMPVNNLVTAPGVTNDGSGQLLAWIAGRISRTTSNQQSVWGTLAFEMDATLYTDVGSIYGDLENGYVVVDDAGIKYRVIGRARSHASGGLPDYFSYPIKSITTDGSTPPSTVTPGATGVPSSYGQAPSAPTSLTVAGVAPSVTVTWTVTLNTVSYDLWRGTSSGGEALLASGITTTTYSDTSGTLGTTYYYEVKARNGFGVSGFSNEDSTIAPPTGVAAYFTPITNSTVVWNAVSGATSYNLYRSVSSGGETILVIGATSPYTDSGLVTGTTYYYKLTAVKSGSESPLSSEVSGAIISGLQLWLKAGTGAYHDAGSTLATNGQTVQQWNDQSGNGRNASQGTPGNRPTYQTGVYNGLSAIQLANVASQGFTSLGFNVGRPMTVALIEKPITAAQSGCRTVQSASVQNAYISLCRSNADNVYLDTNVSDYTPNDTNPHSAILTQQNSGSNSSHYYVDGTEHSNHTDVVNIWNLFAIGGGGFSSEPGNTNLFEVCLYNKVLSGAEMTQLRSYFSYELGTAV